MLSARAGQEAAVEGLSAGADDYLVKPFSAEELLARVGAHLRLGQVRREAEERFTAMADLAPALIWVADAHGGRTFLNQGWRQFTGRRVSGELGSGWETGLHPEDRERYRGGRRRPRCRTAPAGRWSSGCAAGTAPTTGSSSGRCPSAAGTGVVGFVGTCTDINAQFRESERQALLASLGAALEEEPDVEGQLRRLARLTVDRRLADMCTVRRVDDDGAHAHRRRRGDRPGDRGGARRTAPADRPRPPAGRRAGGAAPADPRPGVAGPGRGRPRARLVAAADRRPLGAGRAARRARPHASPSSASGRRADAPEYNEDDRVLVEEFASRAALALDNALLLVEERASAGRLALLQQATAQLSAATTPLQVGGRDRRAGAPADRRDRRSSASSSSTATSARSPRWPSPACRRAPSRTGCRCP